ncbi:MAG: hypothetical protein HOD63_07560 [Bacteroidetes bacterium]|jgi:hypothetical protein|nr:hypothetical protein [Bacteroidota bacterium]MBT5528835.1 hypothetical protein [Cytophagia bacterium]MBT3423676.1 hypothetical protein [Bacteroidota bacterium]MBT3933658.1 hypothetical protein [Bacteroidota bacterium]MBT4338429.1 hypothetical protein [Bacteroidota bacterium]
MTTKLFNFVFFVVIVSLLSATSAFAQKRKVAKIDNETHVVIKNVDVSYYLQQILLDQDVTITDIKLEIFDNTYYLLASDFRNSWIYLLPLKRRNDILYLKLFQRTINACESNNMSISIFNFEEGEIHGCIECNHKISYRSLF